MEEGGAPPPGGTGVEAALDQVTQPLSGSGNPGLPGRGSAVTPPPRRKPGRPALHQGCQVHPRRYPRVPRGQFDGPSPPHSLRCRSPLSPSCPPRLQVCGAALEGMRSFHQVCLPGGRGRQRELPYRANGHHRRISASPTLRLPSLPCSATTFGATRAAWCPVGMLSCWGSAPPPGARPLEATPLPLPPCRASDPPAAKHT